MDDFQEKYSNELTWGKPIIYKNVPIYPVEMSDAHSFQLSSMALTYDQFSYPNKDIAFKPRLSFLIEMGKIAYQTRKESSIEYQLWNCFCYLMCLVFKTDKIGFEDSNNPNRKVLSITYDMEINGEIKTYNKMFGSGDFEEIRKIIMILNDIEIDDGFIHADIKKRMERDAKVMNRSKYLPPDLEDLIDICFMYTGKDYDFIKQMKLRKFSRLIRRISVYEDYKICKTASLSGMVKFTGEIQSWLSSLNAKDKYNGLMQTKEKLVNKYNSI